MPRANAARDETSGGVTATVDGAGAGAGRTAVCGAGDDAGVDATAARWTAGDGAMVAGAPTAAAGAAGFAGAAWGTGA